MKKRKNYGRKIKRNKINLYPRKKTKAQKILGTVLLIILILAIVFLGYCLGKPLLDYLEKRGWGSNSPAWTPPAESTSAVSDIPGDNPAGEITSTDETTAPPVENPNIYAVNVPASALSNSTSLSTFASKSAAEGYTAAIVCLKNSSGYIMYDTEIELLKDSEAVQGMLKASEICNILKQNGLAPVAEVSVLSDNEGGKINSDMCYKIVDEPGISWLDYYSTGQPLRWSDPTSESTASYNNAVTDELKAAGFEKIIRTDIIFPPFQEYDREFVSAEYFASDRYKMLSGVIGDGYVLADSADILLNNMSSTAEMLKNKTTLTENTIVVLISREKFTAEEGYPAEAGNLLEDVMSQCEVKCMGLSLVPMIEKSGFTPDEIAAMKTAAENMGYNEFYVK